MAKLMVDTDKYGYQSDFAVVEAYNSAVKDLMRQRFAAAGKPWRDFVFGADAAVLTKAQNDNPDQATGLRWFPCRPS